MLEDGVFVPGALIDELLECLFGILGGESLGKLDAVREGLDRLPFAIEQESLEVHAGPTSGFGLGEVGGEQSRVVAEAVEDGRIERWRVGFHTSSEGGTP
jgi:hypothetical protein